MCWMHIQSWSKIIPMLVFAWHFNVLGYESEPGSREWGFWKEYLIGTECHWINNLLINGYVNWSQIPRLSKRIIFLQKKSYTWKIVSSLSAFSLIQMSSMNLFSNISTFGCNDWFIYIDGVNRVNENVVGFVYTSNAWPKDCKHSFLQVCGYHLWLHFDGYLSCYDFWTNVGLPGICPVGWCEKTKHDLYIPQGKQEGKAVSFILTMVYEILIREPAWIDFQNENLIHKEP